MNDHKSTPGLLAVREFIDRPNGKITKKSAQGEGTNFKMVI